MISVARTATAQRRKFRVRHTTQFQYDPSDSNTASIGCTCGRCMIGSSKSSSIGCYSIPTSRGSSTRTHSAIGRRSMKSRNLRRDDGHGRVDRGA